MINKDSETWATINDELIKETNRAQKALLQRGMSHDDSNFYRGYHAALARIQALENPVLKAAINLGDYT